MPDPTTILNEHNIVRTSCREGIIGAMLDAGRPLAEHEIREQIQGNYDRSTFYRSFKTLEENHILHRIVVDHQTVLYALDPKLTHGTNHAHFYCEQCNQVRCLEDYIVSNPELPEGFRITNTEMIIRGVCGDCKTTAD